MANENNIKARVQLKHDIEANWNLATNFRPKAGELIVYDPDDNYTYCRYKIGQWTDGNKTQTKLLSALPFEKMRDDEALLYIQQNLTNTQKAQARANIDAVSQSQLAEAENNASQAVSDLSDQLYDPDYGTETGMSIRYIASQVVDNKAVSLNKGTRKNDLDFTYTDGSWNISPIGNYYGSIDTAITVAGYEISDWIIKGVELADGGCKQTLISGDIELSRNTNEDMSWTEWNIKTTVLVNGNPVQTFDADSKADKLVSHGTYGIYASYNDRTYLRTIASTASVLKSGNMPYYVSSTDVLGDATVEGAHLVSTTPTKDAHCANKKYVDEQVQGAKDASVQKITTAKRLYGTSSDGTTTTAYVLNGESAEAGSIPQRRSGGRIVTGTPTADNDATTKKYVDDSIALSLEGYATDDDLSGLSNELTNNYYNKEYVDTKYQEVLEVANGKTKTFTIADMSALGELLSIDTSIVSDEYSITSLIISYQGDEYTLSQGDIFLIIDTDVPDYWVSVNDMKIYKMETSKVDLSEYAKISDVNTSLDGKVDKVNGKGLSTNDLTDKLKSNYDTAYTHSQTVHAPSNAQENVIESIKVNGTAQTITNKSIDIAVPTKVSELTNDSQFATTDEVDAAKQEFFTALNTIDTQIREDLNAVTGSLANEIGDIAETKLDKMVGVNEWTLYANSSSGAPAVVSLGLLTSDPLIGGSVVAYHYKSDDLNDTIVHPSPSDSTVSTLDNLTILVSDPTQDLHAANKGYVDDVADTKLDKTTAGNKVYCTDGYGQQMTRTLTTVPTAGAIPVYGTNGILSVSTPTADNSAANKKYVDDQLDGKVSKSGDTMTGALNVTTNMKVIGDSWNNIGFISTEGKRRGEMMLDASNCIHFNNTETGATYSDRYKLPNVTTGKTADTWYNILTSKNAVTVAQGGTGATTAANAIKNLGIPSVISNPNLLINGDFKINQRGQSSYTGAKYTFDRWCLSNSYSTITENTNGGVTFSASGGNAYLIQRIENGFNSLKGKTVTYSIKINNVIYSKTGTIPTSKPSSGTSSIGEISITGGTAISTYLNSSGILFVQIGVKNGNSFNIEYVKLEIGSYATPFSPRPYAEELAMCQRYYQVVHMPYRFLSLQESNNSSYIYVQVPVNPNVATSSTPVITNNNCHGSSGTGSSGDLNFSYTSTHYRAGDPSIIIKLSGGAQLMSSPILLYGFGSIAIETEIK